MFGFWLLSFVGCFVAVGGLLFVVFARSMLRFVFVVVLLFALCCCLLLFVLFGLLCLLICLLLFVFALLLRFAFLVVVYCTHCGVFGFIVYLVTDCLLFCCCVVYCCYVVVLLGVAFYLLFP